MTYSLRSFLPVLILICVCPRSLTAQADPDNLRINEYLKTFTVEYNEREKHGGIPVQFTGEYSTIPNPIQQSLLSAFPKHRFAVANMLYLHYTWYPGVHLFIVTDKDSGNVVSYAWDLWFNGVPDSFRGLLIQSPASSKKDALTKVQALSELLVFPTDGRVGKLEDKNGVISSELYIRSDWPWRVLRVKLDGQFRFGQIAFINPKNGKEASTLSLK